MQSKIPKVCGEQSAKEIISFMRLLLYADNEFYRPSECPNLVTFHISVPRCFLRYTRTIFQHVISIAI